MGLYIFVFTKNFPYECMGINFKSYLSSNLQLLRLISLHALILLALLGKNAVRLVLLSPIPRISGGKFTFLILCNGITSWGRSDPSMWSSGVSIPLGGVGMLQSSVATSLKESGSISQHHRCWPGGREYNPVVATVDGYVTKPQYGINTMFKNKFPFQSLLFSSRDKFSY